MRSVPPEILEYEFLREFPGYTRELMEREPAWWVERMLATKQARERVEAQMQRRSMRRGPR